MDKYSDIDQFLAVPTPAAWVSWAAENLETLLWDHGNCEKKAASAAMALLYRYSEKTDIVFRMSRIAREELRHFEQVQKIIQQREYHHRVVPAAKYAARLRNEIRKEEPGRLLDQLIVGAFIEARSCERFGALAPQLDEELKAFYLGLMKSEARHFQEYLKLAESLCSQAELEERVATFRDLEASAVNAPDAQFAFHSGPPILASEVAASRN